METSVTTLRLATVPVFVGDQERALAFYRDRLGFEVVTDQPTGGDGRWITVAPGGGGTEILLYRPGMFGEEGASLADRVGVWTAIVFVTDDIDAAYAALVERGVDFAGPPERQPWGGLETSFADPDGNRFELVERPGGDDDPRS